MLGSIGARLDNTDEPVASNGWPQEVRKLLFEANEQASVLRAERQALVARAEELEERLEAANARIAQLSEQLEAQGRALRRSSEPVRRPEQQWVHDVADRTATALRSGQQVAQALVDRAQQRAAELEEAALREAAGIRKRAEAQAAKVLSVAQYDAEGILEGAQASAEELLAAAHEHGQAIVADLRRREATLAEEIDYLEARRLEVMETFAALRGPVDEAIHLLDTGSDRLGPSREAPLAARIRAARSSRGRRTAMPTAQPEPDPYAPVGDPYSTRSATSARTPSA